MNLGFFTELKITPARLIDNNVWATVRVHSNRADGGCEHHPAHTGLCRRIYYVLCAFHCRFNHLLLYIYIYKQNIYSLSHLKIWDQLNYKFF